MKNQMTDDQQIDAMIDFYKNDQKIDEGERQRIIKGLEESRPKNNQVYATEAEIDAAFGKINNSEEKTEMDKVLDSICKL